MKTHVQLQHLFTILKIRLARSNISFYSFHTHFRESPRWDTYSLKLGFSWPFGSVNRPVWHNNCWRCSFHLLLAAATQTYSRSSYLCHHHHPPPPPATSLVPWPCWRRRELKTLQFTTDSVIDFMDVSLSPCQTTWMSAMRQGIGRQITTASI